MKKYVLLVAAAFLCTNSYAIDMPWFKPKPAPQKDKAKEVVVVKPKPAAPAKMVVAKPVPPAKVVVVNPAPPVNVPPPAPAAVLPQKKLTREEMIARITEVLNSRPNIASAIQGLAATQGEGGVTVYAYNGKKLGDLDEDTLFRILSMINQQISLDNLQKLERQQRQLKNLQQIDQMNRTQRMLKQQQALTKPAAPKAYVPPKVPRTRY